MGGINFIDIPNESGLINKSLDQGKDLVILKLWGNIIIMIVSIFKLF